MPAVPTATAVSKAIARAAGALRRVLIGVPSKDMPMCTDARETIDALTGGQRSLRSRPGHDGAGRKQTGECGGSGAGK